VAARGAAWAACWVALAGAARAQSIPGKADPVEAPPRQGAGASGEDASGSGDGAGAAAEADGERGGDLRSTPPTDREESGPGHPLTPPSGRSSGWVVLPGLSYTPEHGLTVAGAVLRYFRPEEEDRRSSRIGLQAGISLDGRAEVDFDPELWFLSDRLNIDGSSQVTYFDYSYFGIGNDTPDEAGEDYTAFRVNARVELIGHLTHTLYSGVLYDFRYEDITRVEPGGALDAGAAVGAGGGFLSGVGALIRWDSRDHSYSPRSGGVVTFSPRLYAEALGSDFTFSRWLIDASWFFGLGGAHVIGVDARGDFRTGDPPFDHLSLAGGSRLLRGMLEGRYRDMHYVAAQAEYRFPIYWRFGGVAFAGAGRVAGALDELALADLKYSVGGGLRFAVNPDERINVRFDVGHSDGETNVYFRILEAF